MTLVTAFNQSLANRVTEGREGISPWWTLGTIGAFTLMRVAINNYGEFEKVQAELLSSNSELDAIRNSAPRIVFDMAVRKPLQFGAGDLERHHGVWQLWFVNRPIRSTPNATALAVTAEITFYDSTGTDVQLQFIGQWAISAQPEHAGWSEIRPAIDMPAGHIWAKLLLLVQTETVTTCIVNDAEEVTTLVYGLSGENLHERPLDADHDHYVLDKPAKRLRISLMGTNMEAERFEFDIQRAEDGEVLAITRIE